MYKEKSKLETQKEHISVNSISFAQKVSSDGVFFRCSNCHFEPEMKSKTDDLLNMNYCPKCSSQFI